MTREEYVRTMHSRLDRWNNEIGELIAKKDHLEASMRDGYSAKMEDLRTRTAAARDELVQIEQASEGAWQDIKSGFELAWEALGEAVDSAGSHFKK